MDPIPDVVAWAVILALGIYIGSFVKAFRGATQVPPAEPTPQLRGFSYADLVLSEQPPPRVYPDDALERATQAYLDLGDEDALELLNVMRQQGSLIVRDELRPPLVADHRVSLTVLADGPISAARTRMLARLVLQALDETAWSEHGSEIEITEPAPDPVAPPSRAIDLGPEPAAPGRVLDL